MYERAGRLVIVEYNERPLRGLRFLATPGHTPGHASISLSSRKRRFVYSGDVFRTKVYNGLHFYYVSCY